VYKLVVTTAGEFTFSLRWSNQADLGLYFLGADLLDTGFHDCDILGRGAGSGPETCTTELDPGTYYLAAVPFGAFYPENDPNPSWVSIRVSQ
jgi:hypothetical protein